MFFFVFVSVCVFSRDVYPVKTLVQSNLMIRNFLIIAKLNWKRASFLQPIMEFMIFVGFHFCFPKLFYEFRALFLKVGYFRNVLFVSSISSKIWTKTSRIVVKLNSFVRFLEEFTVWQFAFKINWPLVVNAVGCMFFLYYAMNIVVGTTIHTLAMNGVSIWCVWG